MLVVFDLPLYSEFSGFCPACFVIICLSYVSFLLNFFSHWQQWILLELDLDLFTILLWRISHVPWVVSLWFMRLCSIVVLNPHLSQLYLFLIKNKKCSSLFFLRLYPKDRPKSWNAKVRIKEQGNNFRRKSLLLHLLAQGMKEWLLAKYFFVKNIFFRSKYFFPLKNIFLVIC